MKYKVLIILICLAATALAVDALDVAEKSEAVYARAGSFTAEFVQKVATGGFFADEETFGILLMEYPRHFRIETPEQVITCDGDTIWSYSVENKQVTVEAVDKVEDLVTPVDFLFNFRENYHIAYDTTVLIGDIKAYKLRLMSKSRDEYVQGMALYVKADDYTVLRVRYTDINDNVITIDFSKLKLGDSIESSRFRFKTPKGVEEVRLP